MSTIKTITVVLEIDSDILNPDNFETELSDLFDQADLTLTPFHSLAVMNVVEGNKLDEKPQHFSDRELAARGLPPIAYAANPSDNGVAFIERGGMGYFPHPLFTPDQIVPLNEVLGLSEAQVAAMQWGSMFGWHTPGAWPEHQTELLAKRTNVEKL